MLPIFVPSMQRFDAKWLKNSLYSLIGADHPMCYVVPKSEEEQYKLLGVPVHAHPDEVRGIAAVRLYIGQLAAAWGCDKFIMIDDDLQFYARRSATLNSLQNITANGAREMLTTVERYLGEYSQVGIATRQGNNRAGVGPAPLAVEATRTNSVTAYLTEDFLSVEHGRVEVMEDFDVSLQLLRSGRKSCTFYYWAHDQAQTQNPGGCSVYRTLECQDRSARKLAELHPGFVTLRQKKNKTGGEFGTRTEVTIQWKKAFASSQK